MMSGREAQRKGQEFNDIWKPSQILYLQGKKIPRESRDYQRILDDLYNSVFRLVDFQDELIETGNEELVHSIGKDDPRDTVLTVQEFCSRLVNERRRIRRVRGILTVEEMNDAAKKIEIDGDEAFHAVSEMYGKQVARLLLIAHIRRGKGSMSQYPSDPSIDDTIFEIFGK